VNVSKSRLTRKLLKLLPHGYGRVFYGCNGADAVEAALRAARIVAGRQNIIAFWDEYHGASMGATSVTGLKGWQQSLGPYVPGSIFVPGPYHYRSPLGGRSQEETDRLTVEFLRKTIEQAGPETIAAVVGEPLTTGGGAIRPGEGYWQKVRGLCDQYDILLIADEVVTGFGRTGHWFGIDHYIYRPDMICLGKGLSSGTYLCRLRSSARSSPSALRQSRSNTGHVRWSPLVLLGGISLS
jgi:taurine--2-oxoglutarate transaminase